MSVDLIRGALMEAGWDPIVRDSPGGPEVKLLPSKGGVSAEACWMAFYVTGGALRCWPCWDAGAETCDHPINCEMPDMAKVSP